MKTKWQCPSHRKALSTIQDYPGALVHPGCPHIFMVIDDRLHVHNDKGQWEDVENGNILTLGQMTEHIYEMTVYSKNGKLIKSTILTDCERDRIPRRRNENEAEVIETISKRSGGITQLPKPGNAW